MAQTNNGGGTPQGAPSSTPNPDTNRAAADPMALLTQMQDSMDRGTTAAPTPQRQATPEPGENGLETNPEDEEQTTETVTTTNADGTEATHDGGENGNQTGQLPPELAALAEDVRNDLLDLARDVADGTVNFGDVKRGHRIAQRFAEEREELQGQIAALREQVAGGTTTASTPASLPQNIAALKTMDEVQARMDAVQTMLDWCQDNPDGGEIGEGDNARTLTAEQVRSARTKLRDEMRLLPKREEQINQTAQWSTDQKTAKANAYKLFPHLADANNAETKQVKALLETAPWITRTFLSPHLAALTWLRGQAAVRATAKGARTPNANAQRSTPNANGVARGRPAAGGTSAGGARPNAGKPTVRSATDRISGGDRSVVALADLITARGD